MRTWLITACLLALLSGCATQPHVNSHIESVNAEYRQLEDYVYALEEENTRLHQEIDTLRAGVPVRTPGGAAPSRGGLFRRSPSGTTPRPDTPGTPADQPPEFQSPQIEIPPSTPPSGRSTTQRPEFTDPSETPPSVAPSREPARETERGSEGMKELLPIPGLREIHAPAMPDPISPKPLDKKITHLFVNPSLTGGADFDGQPGDDGLRIVLEPRNAGDQFVAEAGTLSLVLLDPERQGESARIARWDFDPSATRQLLVASSPRRGLKVEVPWPSAPPAANRLKLFVRYETPDGRRLQADREIFVRPPGESVSRWTPRSSDVKLSTFDVQPSAPSALPQPESPSAISAIPIWSPQR